MEKEFPKKVRAFEHGFGAMFVALGGFMCVLVENRARKVGDFDVRYLIEYEVS